MLVVDGEECIRDLVRLILQNAECRVLDAADGSAGLAVAAHEHPDVIVLERRLSGLRRRSPPTAARRWAHRPYPHHHHERNTGRVRPGLPARTQRHGYLVKPFRPLELLQEIEQVFRLEPRNAA